MIERAALRGPDVIQDCPCRRSGCPFSCKPKALEGEHSEMILEERNGVVGSKDPVVERSFGPAPARDPSDRRRARVRSRSFAPDGRDARLTRQTGLRAASA